MKAPKYQRVEILAAALQEAGHSLDDPIEGLEITDKGIVAWAAGRFILMTYRWDNDYNTDGTPLPGGGAWSVQYVADCDSSYRGSPSG
jgi:hypothetical protein